MVIYLSCPLLLRILYFLLLNLKENNEKKINNEHEISKLIKAFPKDIASKNYSVYFLVQKEWN